MPQRRPLAPIGANRVQNSQLSEVQRAQIFGQAVAGAGDAAIALKEHLPLSTIKSTIAKVRKRHSVVTAPRKGRPKVFSDRDQRHLLRYIRANPQATWSAIKTATGLEFSRQWLSHIMKEHHIQHWLAKKRPLLLPHHAQQRLQFAHQYRHLTPIEWRQNWVFSDECSVEFGTGKKRVWSFGYPSQKWNHDKIVEYPKGKQASLMVYAAIGPFGATELIIMERDKLSPRGGYSSASYQWAVEAGLVPIYNGETYVHDNAPVHTSASTVQWLGEIGIHLFVSWPPYSPDLNPIEHLWARLKEMLYELHPNLHHITNKATQLQALTEHLPTVWEQLKAEWIEAVLDSMPDRLQAVIDANGWQTRY